MAREKDAEQQGVSTPNPGQAIPALTTPCTGLQLQAWVQNALALRGGIDAVHIATTATTITGT